MIHIDLKTLKRIHNVYDNLTLGNKDLAYTELGKILTEKQCIINVVSNC